MTKPEQDDEKLKASEERYRSLFDNAVDAIFIATSEGVFTDVNVSGELLLGYERGELIGKGIVNILHPEDLNRFLVARESMLEGNTRLDEWTLIRKDGTLIAVEISANMLLDQCFQAFVRDITERKRMEELSKRLARHAMLRADVHAVMSSGEKSLQSVLQNTMESIVRHTDAAFARVWLLDEKRQVLELQASAGIYTRIDGTHSHFEVGQYKIGEIAALKKSLFSNAILELEQIDKEWAKREKLISFAGFPLIVNDKVIGVAAMFSRRAMPDDVLEAFESIAAVIAQGVERKRAEEQLMLFKYTIDHVFDSAGIISPDGRFIFANDACCKSLGYTRDELLQLTVPDIDPNFPAELWSDHYQDLRVQKSLTLESTHRRKDGSVFPIELSLNFMEYNGQEYNFAIGRDITERKRAEVELREKQQLLQAIVDNSTALIHVQDLDYRALLVNRSFAQLMGLSPEQMQGKTDYEIWQMSPLTEADPEIDIDSYRTAYAEAFAAGTVMQKELSISLVGVGRCYFLTTKCLLLDAAGNPDSILTIATDITEIKRGEKEMRRLQTELEHAARAMTMGALASSIAHEVNQPLAGIVTNGSACLRWLAMDPPDLEEARNAVNRIIRDGNRASEVIARTRALLKKTPPQKSALDINEIAGETIALAQYEIQKNKIHLLTNFSHALPNVAGDKIQLQQVLLNLLMNGIDALAKAVPNGERELSVESRKYEEDNILIVVKDSGIGLDAGNLDKIFEAFYTTKEEGMGMGLSISRSIIEAHGGRLWATLNDGKGATFQFSLPIETNED
jgi:PAS domain S-box-containing protein